MTLIIRTASQSITGNHRAQNEDRCHADAAAGLFMVADGMGGQQAGEKASEMAVELLAQKLAGIARSVDRPALDDRRVVALIQDAITEANAEIMALGQIDFHYHSMGTTVVVLAIVGDCAYVSGVGDSRAYLVRGSKIEQLTRDHSVAESLAEAGAISRAEIGEHRYRHVLWKFLGTKEAASRPEVGCVSLHPGDRLLLCSDGLTGAVADRELHDTLRRETDPAAAAAALVQQAIASDSHDNITCVAVYVD